MAGAVNGRARLRGLALGPLLVAAVGCNPFDLEGCTLIGCTSVLEVELTGPLEYPFTLTVSGEGDSRSVECTAQEPCTGARFEDFTPDRATIVYESAGRGAEWTLALEYRRWRPNGDDCEPECLTATIELDTTS